MSVDNVIFGPTLADAFLTAGLPYQGESQTGKMHRFPTSENDRADKSGWLRIFPDGDGAAFGCWRHGASFVWQRRDDGAPPPSDAERAAARAKADAANREAELQRVEKHTKGAATAARIWGETLDLGAHGYIAKKGVKPHDARLDLDGRMVLPVHDADGIIQSLQFIAADGEKRFLPGGKMQGGRLFLGAPVDGSPLLLCEGFATAASLREATGMVVVVAFSGSNLKHVAADLARQFPRSRLTVAGDRDAHGRGAEYAQAAADAAVGALVVLPRFADGRDRGDFNDVHTAEGLESVKRQITVSMAVPSKYRLLTDAELALLPSLRWIIKSVLPESGLGALFGASGSGKSFLVLDALHSLAAGSEWFGHRVKSCKVT